VETSISAQTVMNKAGSDQLSSHSFLLLTSYHEAEGFDVLELAAVSAAAPSLPSPPGRATAIFLKRLLTL
jgi:hypothetical protein